MLLAPVQAKLMVLTLIRSEGPVRGGLAHLLISDRIANLLFLLQMWLSTYQNMNHLEKMAVTRNPLSPA